MAQPTTRAFRPKVSLCWTMPAGGKANSRLMPSAIFVSASHQTGLDTRSMTQRSIIVGIRRGDNLSGAEAQAQLVYASHRPISCDVGPDVLSRTWTQIWAQAWMSDYSLNWKPVLYKGDKSVNDAVRPTKCGPAEAVGLSASSLPLLNKAKNKLMPLTFVTASY